MTQIYSANELESCDHLFIGYLFMPGARSHIRDSIHSPPQKIKGKRKLLEGLGMVWHILISPSYQHGQK